MKEYTKARIGNFIRFLRETGELSLVETKRIIDSLSDRGEELDHFLTRKEVAKILKVSEKTVSRRTKEGILRKYQTGEREYRYLKSEIFNLGKKDVQWSKSDHPVPKKEAI